MSLAGHTGNSSYDKVQIHDTDVSFVGGSHTATGESIALRKTVVGSLALTFDIEGRVADVRGNMDMIMGAVRSSAPSDPPHNPYFDNARSVSIRNATVNSVGGNQHEFNFTDRTHYNLPPYANGGHHRDMPVQENSAYSAPHGGYPYPMSQANGPNGLPWASSANCAYPLYANDSRHLNPYNNTYPALPANSAPPVPYPNDAHGTNGKYACHPIPCLEDG
jgi:hypothetical protein